MAINVSLHESSPEKLLIIGCGDIGHRLARQLASKQYVITGLKRSAAVDLPYLHFLQADASDLASLTAVLTKGFDVVVMSMTPSERTDAGYEQAYVRCCEHLVTALKQLHQQPRLIMFVSSTSVYAQDDGSWIDENSPTTPESFSGKRLLEAEQGLQNSEFTHSIVRFSGIYGPGRTRLIEQVRQGRAPHSACYTNRIHADDCAGVLAHLIEHHKTHALAPVYLASDSAPSPMIDVVSWIAAQLGITDFLSADTVNERGNKRISNQQLLGSGYQLRYPDFRLGYKTLLEPQAPNTNERIS